MKELNNSNTTIIEHNGGCYAFDYINYEIMKLDEPKIKIFNNLLENKTIPTDSNLRQDLFNIIMKIKAGFFFTEKEIALHLGKHNKGAYIISFPIIHSCNLRCKYCFAESGNTYEGLKRNIDISSIDKMISSLPSMGKHPVTHIRLEYVSGGETFLNKKLFKESIRRIKKLALAHNFKLQIFALTNGTMLDKGIIDFISANDIFLGISLDGDAETHNFQRPYMNGKGTYDTVASNIKQIMATSIRNNIWLVSVITSHTKSLIKLLQHGKSLGIKTIEMRIARGENKFGLSITYDNIDHFKHLYYEFAEYLKSNINDIYVIVNNYDTFGKLIKRLLLKEKIQYRCQAGRRKFSFTADGEIYPCDSFVGNKSYRIGNVNNNDRNNEIQDLFNDMTVIKLEKCCTCCLRYLCGGDCYFNMLLNKNSFLYCELQKHLCTLAIDLIYYLAYKDPKEYDKLIRFSKLRE